MSNSLITKPIDLQLLDIDEAKNVVEKEKELLSFDQQILKGQGIFLEDDKNRITFKFTRFISYINSLGYCYIPNMNIDDREAQIKDVKYYQIIDMVAYSRSRQDIFEVIRQDIDNSKIIEDKDKERYKDCLYNNQTKYFKDESLRNIKRNQFENLKLSKDYRVYPFVNCVIILDPKNKTPISLTYKELKEDIRYNEHLIFENEIKNNSINIDKFNLIDFNTIDFKLMSYTEICDSSFSGFSIYEFIKNLAVPVIEKQTDVKNKELINNFLKTIGYINRGYHPKPDRRIVFFVDGEDVNLGSSNGQRGKTICLNIIQSYNQGLKVEANNVNLTEKFSLSGYKPESDNLLLFNDVDGIKSNMRDYFPYTEGLRIEVKGKTPTDLNLVKTPLTAVTCNYLPKFKNDDLSTLNRIIVLEASRYYNKQKSPQSEFKEMLCMWNKNHKNWNMFYNLMFALDFKYRIDKENNPNKILEFSESIFAINTLADKENGSDNNAIIIELIEDNNCLIDGVTGSRFYKMAFKELVGLDFDSNIIYNRKEINQEAKHIKTMIDNLMLSKYKNKFKIKDKSKQFKIDGNVFRFTEWEEIKP